MKRSLGPTFFVVTILIIAIGTSNAAPAQHRDIHSHVVPGSIIPPVFGGTWTVDSRLDILSAEPHTILSKHSANFHFREFFNLTASSFDPLIVPGTPNVAPTTGGDRLDNKTWTFSIQNEGCATFDYSSEWGFKINPNLGSEVSPKFRLGLSKGPVEFDVEWGGGTIPETTFLFTPFPNRLEIEFATSDLGQGFFANGGLISINGEIKAQAEGAGKIFAENPHYASGKGLLVDDFTWAQPDANGNPAIITTHVFDTYTCVVPPPPPPVPITS